MINYIIRKFSKALFAKTVYMTAQMNIHSIPNRYENNNATKR